MYILYVHTWYKKHKKVNGHFHKFVLEKLIKNIKFITIRQIYGEKKTREFNLKYAAVVAQRKM